MRTRLKALAVLGFLLLLGSVIALTVTSKGRKEKPFVPSNGRLKWHAAEAKKEGRTKAVIPTPIFDYLGTENKNIEQALSDYTVVIARPVAKRAYQVDDNTLMTWYQFRIVEALTPTKNPVCFGCLSVNLPPYLFFDPTTEFLVPRNGGNATVDGVEIEQKESGFPEFRINEKYLLFISLYPNRIAFTAGGPTGVFAIDDKEILSPINDQENNIREGITSKFKSSLKLLRQRSDKR